ncbi:hypothetical protein B0H13DRAFT_1886073 [Mycena leptocephala]|nr:hypothetical protein B0H13DRAFT_1886073 [Mycena leptocephala]
MQSGLGDETNTHPQRNQRKLPLQYDEGEYVGIAPKFILISKTADSTTNGSPGTHRKIEERGVQMSSKRRRRKSQTITAVEFGKDLVAEEYTCGATRKQGVKAKIPQSFKLRRIMMWMRWQRTDRWRDFRIICIKPFKKIVNLNLRPQVKAVASASPCPRTNGITDDSVPSVWGTLTQNASTSRAQL